jgi:hypothetical protein
VEGEPLRGPRPDPWETCQLCDEVLDRRREHGTILLSGPDLPRGTRPAGGRLR